VALAKVDVAFSLTGSSIPVDHGYCLFSAVSRVVPQVHKSREIGIHPISGRLIGSRTLALTPTSCLTLRLPQEQLGQVLPLAGKLLQLGDSRVRVGVPHTRALRPSKRLYSRVVIIKGFSEPQLFLDAVVRQLAALGIHGEASLVEQQGVADSNVGKLSGSHSPYLRRTVRICSKDIVGFAVLVGNLRENDSVLLQETGIGGRRRFGCGVFVPVKE